MSIPEQYRRDVEALPALLRALLDEELAAGNEIDEVGHSFPAPPAGAYIKLKRPTASQTYRHREGMSYYARNSSLYSGEYTDAKRVYFILEPALPPPPEPDMDAIREALARRANANVVSPYSWSPFEISRENRPPVPAASSPSSAAAAAASANPPAISAPVASALHRFQKSMLIDYEKWHDGIGYDLDALREATPAERETIESLLVSRGDRDWRDVEALAALATPGARHALKAALRDGNAEIRLAVTRHAPELVSKTARAASLIDALQHAEIFGGLTAALDEAQTFHPPRVVDALLRGALDRTGDVAVHLAALLAFLHGKAEAPFDTSQRPFFLRFNTADRAERETVFAELCDKIGVNAGKYLKPLRPKPAAKKS